MTAEDVCGMAGALRALYEQANGAELFLLHMGVLSLFCSFCWNGFVILFCSFCQENELRLQMSWEVGIHKQLNEHDSLQLLLCFRLCLKQREGSCGSIANMVPFICLSIIMDGLQAVLSGVARGSGWQHIGAYDNFGACYLVGVPLVIVYAFVVH
nr:protein detoxification 13 [Quercus suber]